MQLDYSPLGDTKPVPLQSELTDIPPLSNKVGALIITGLIVAFTAFLIIPIFLSPLIYKAIKNLIDKSGASAIRLSNFAVKNGFTYRWGVKDLETAETVNLKGVIGSTASSVAASNIVTGVYKDFSFQLFNPTQKGLYTIMKITLNNQYPHILLDSRVNNPFFSNIGRFFGQESRIHLEGDFDTYFSVYAKASPIDTLRILSPDMMSIMVDSGHKYDIEIVEDNLNIISNYKFTDEAGIKYFFDVADALLDKLDRRIETVNASFDSASRVD